MPTQPPLDGLPLWAQIAISLAIGLATLGVAFKGYFTKDKPDTVAGDKQTAAIMAATIADGFAIRALSDSCIRLEAAVESLTKATDESTHWRRNGVELEREMCARLRELQEELERQGRDARLWDKRDEQRR